MKTFRKHLARILALLLVVSMVMPMAACRKQGNTTETTGTTEGAPITYTVKVETTGGVPMSGVGVYIYQDETQNELVWFDQTGEDGTMSFTDIPRDTYVAVLSDVPTGYAAKDFYPITGQSTTIVLEVGVLDAESAKDLVYKLGDMMLDFTVKDPSGVEYTLSELLKQKKAVMLNFWYIGCEPCKAEFPFLQEAYEEYSEDVAVLAMNHIDPEADIAAFQKENGYTFPMVSCDPMWQQLMNLTAYPTTVMIDRFGNICLIHKGTIDNAKTFKDTFAFFAAEEYEPTVVKDIEELATEEEEGSKDNPQDATGQSSFQVEVEAGKEVYTELYKAKGMYLRIKGPNQDFYVLYNEKEYTPDSSNSVGFVITTGDNYTPSVFAIGNTSKEKQTYDVYLSHLPGTFNNPYDLELGEFTATINAGNDQGVYFRGTAPEDGKFIAQCISAPAGVKYDFFLQSMDVNWTVLRNYSSEGSIDEEGYPTVEIPIKKGMDIMFSVGTLPDDSNNYPGGTFKFRVTFEAGEVETKPTVEKMDYTVTVTDDAGLPLEGVAVWLSKEGETVSSKTDAKGVVTMNLEKTTYTGTVSIPEGYTLDNNSFTLTPEAPTATVKLTKNVDTRVDYTITVYDPDGNPVSGVEVLILGVGSATTNAQGVVSFKLEPGNYSVLAGTMPAGFECNEMLTLTATQTTGELHLAYMLGTEQNPISLLEEQNTLTNQGTTYYCTWYNCAIMEVTGTADFHVLLNGQKLLPTDNTVSQLLVSGSPRMPTVFAIVGDGEFTVRFTYPTGHQMNPALMFLGHNVVADHAGLYDYHFTWTAVGQGELTITMTEDIQWVYSVTNVTTGVATEIHWSNDDPVISSETIPVSEGDEIQVVINTYVTGTGAVAQSSGVELGFDASFVWTLECENFTTAPVPAAGSWSYRFASPEGATMTIENANAYVVYNGTTYNADSEGKVTVALGNEEVAELVIGNLGEDAESFDVSFSWPEGSRRNPKQLRFRFPQTILANLEAGDTDGYYFVTYPTLLGTLNFVRATNGAEASAYTITLIRNDGEEVLMPEAEDDTKAVEVYLFPDDELLIHVQAVPSEDGTYPAVSNIRTSATFTQDFTIRIVTFDANGGTLVGEATMETVNGKLPAMPEDPQRADHIFLGWFDAPEGGKQVTTATAIRGDMTVYAQWEKIEYTVTFDPRGGTVNGSSTVRTVDYRLPELPTATMNGYTFLGWFDQPAGGNAITTNTVFTGNTTVYAQWKTESTGGETGEMITYQVSVIDEKGQPVTSGVYVTWQNAERMVTKVINNASGSVSAQLPAAQYNLILTMTGAYAGYCYDAASAVTSAANHDVTVQIAKPLASDAEQTDYSGIVTLDVPMGATYVKLNGSQPNYSVQDGKAYCFFRYAITEEGKYAFSVSNGAPISNWGTNTFYIHNQSTEEERQKNAFEVEIKDTYIPVDTGVMYLIFAVEITTFTDTILLIKDAGDVEYTYLDAPFLPYEGTQTPAVQYVEGKATAIEANIFHLNTGGKSLKYVDMLTQKAVKGDDGYYHLNSKTGPVLYVNLGEDAPYISMGVLTGAIGQYGTGFKKIFFNEDGTPMLNPDGTYKKEDYTAAMIAYSLHVDPTTGVYPLNDDLIYMLQNGGEFKGWYTPGSGTYLFEEKDITVDNSLAWMFAVCYLN